MSDRGISLKVRLLGLGAIVVASLVICAASSSATGTASRAGCTPPSVNGFAIQSLYEHGGIGCSHASHLLVENIGHSRLHSYTCNHRISGRNVHMHCTSTLNSAHQYSSSYYVH